MLIVIGGLKLFNVFLMRFAEIVRKRIYCIPSKVNIPQLFQQFVQLSSQYLSLGIPRDLVNKGDPSSQLLVVIHLPVHRLLHLLGAQLCASLPDHLQ